MRYFPISLDTQNLNVVLFGGGVTAEAKIKLLLKSQARLFVVSAQVTPRLKELGERGELAIIHTPTHDISQATLSWDHFRVAYDALETPAEIEAGRAWIRAQCEAHGVLLNVVDERALCQFITPALIDRDPVSVAISTGGTAPMLGRLIRAQIERLLPQSTGALARWSETRREEVARVLPAGSPRRDFWGKIFDGDHTVGRQILIALQEGDWARADRFFDTLLHDHQEVRSSSISHDATSPLTVSMNAQATRGEMYLIGAGPGDPDLITVRAAQVIARADVIITDRLVNPLIIERYARREAEVIYVGKNPRGHSTPQHEINQLLQERGASDQVVVRLKGGDPMIFGRASDELIALMEAGIRCEVIPGVSAAVAGASLLQLPLTQRSVHRQCVIATAMSCEGPVEHPWVEFARSGALLALYMSARLAGQIAERLLTAGLDPETPVTVAASISTPQQAHLCGALHELEHLAQALSPHPMILYIGAHPLEVTHDASVISPPSITRPSMTSDLPRSSDDFLLTPSDLSALRISPAHRTASLPLGRPCESNTPVAWTCESSDAHQRQRA